MKNLANIDEVGHGIAVAFVATVYGVGVANVLLIPAANKIKARVQEQTTLLFAFFVVMFATSQTDRSKAQQVSDSVNKALEGQSFSAAAPACWRNRQ